MKLDFCSNCNEIETYRKCNNKPLCIICEINLKHKKPISQVVINHSVPIPNSDLENVGVSL